jgi:hypothetical protein
MTETKTQTVRIVREIEASEFWPNVLGAGWESMPWWRKVRYSKGADWDTCPEGAELIVWARDPDVLGAKAERYTITLEILVEAFNKAQRECVDACTGLPLDIDNLDACGSDAIIQTAAFGKVIYS